MNLREIQLLQEAYMSVYEETDEERDKRLADRRARVAELQASGRTMTPARRAREKAQQRKTEQEQEKLDKILGSIRGGSSRRSDKPMGSTHPAEKEAAPEANRRLKSKTKSDTLASRADEILRGMRKEDVNVFDILISHLLDEGYADDVKNAYCILENMSEEWVLEILDEKTATPPSKFNVRKGLDAKSRRLRRSSDFYTYGEDPDPEDRRISTSKGEGGITKNPKKLRKQKAMGEHP